MPGVGPRSAERIALVDRAIARRSAGTYRARDHGNARQTVRPCKRCGFFTTEELCDICSRRLARDADLLCVVEQPTDILPLEKTSAFRGRYHSLGGRISPLDHVGPDDLRIKELVARVEAREFFRDHFRARRRCGRRSDDQLPGRVAESQFRSSSPASRTVCRRVAGWNQRTN